MSLSEKRKEIERLEHQLNEKKQQLEKQAANDCQERMKAYVCEPDVEERLWLHWADRRKTVRFDWQINLRCGSILSSELDNCKYCTLYTVKFRSQGAAADCGVYTYSITLGHVGCVCLSKIGFVKDGIDGSDVGLLEKPIRWFLTESNFLNCKKLSLGEQSEFIANFPFDAELNRLIFECASVRDTAFAFLRRQTQKDATQFFKLGKPLEASHDDQSDPVVKFYKEQREVDNWDWYIDSFLLHQ